MDDVTTPAHENLTTRTRPKIDMFMKLYRERMQSRHSSEGTSRDRHQRPAIPTEKINSSEGTGRDELQMPGMPVGWARNFLKERKKSTKKDFINFLKYYNSHGKELALNEVQVQALQELRQKWVQSASVHDGHFYFGMKNQHTILNDKLWKNEAWRKYVNEFLEWRPVLMAAAHYAGTWNMNLL